jgi:hypothetical protein
VHRTEAILAYAESAHERGARRERDLSGSRPDSMPSAMTIMAAGADAI